MGTRKKTFGTRTKLPAFGTDFGSVIRLDPNNFNSISFSLILDEVLQLEETPIANPIVHSLSSANFSDSFEVFHNNLVSVEIGNNLFAYVMIYPLHKTVFSSRQLLEKPSAGASAFALKFGTQVFEFSFNLLDFTAIKEFIIRYNSKIFYSEINAKNSILDVRALNIDFFGKTKQEETSSFSINSQEAFCNIPILKILRITFRNTNIKLLPSFDCEDTQNIIFERSTPIKIISNGNIINYRFGFSSFNHTTRLLDTSNSELCLKSRLFQGFINKWMELNVIADSSLPSLIDTELQTFTITSDGSNYFRCCTNLDFSCCPNIYNLNNHSNYINVSEGVSPPNSEGMGIRNEYIL